MNPNSKGRLRRLSVLAIAMTTLLGSAGAALAQPRVLLLPSDSDAPGVLFAAQRGGISLAQATAMAQSRYQGRVVSAKTIMAGDRVIHEVRILGNDGRVHTVRIDAQSGSFL